MHGMYGNRPARLDLIDEGARVWVTLDKDPGTGPTYMLVASSQVEVEEATDDEFRKLAREHRHSAQYVTPGAPGQVRLLELADRYEARLTPPPVYGGTGSRWVHNDPKLGWGWYDGAGRWHEDEHPDAWQVPQDDGPYSIGGDY